MAGRKKNSTLEVRGKERFFILIFFSFLILATFWKNDCSATWKPNSFKKNLTFGQLKNVQRYQKHVPLVWSFIFRVSYMFKPTVKGLRRRLYCNCSYLHTLLVVLVLSIFFFCFYHKSLQA